MLISVAQLMVVLDAHLANIALPYIGADLDIDQANLSWIVTGYALAFGGLLLLGGRLGGPLRPPPRLHGGPDHVRHRVPARRARARTGRSSCPPEAFRASAPRLPPPLPWR